MSRDQEVKRSSERNVRVCTSWARCKESSPWDGRDYGQSENNVGSCTHLLGIGVLGSFIPRLELSLLRLELGHATARSVVGIFAQTNTQLNLNDGPLTSLPFPELQSPSPFSPSSHSRLSAEPELREWW